MRQQFIALVGPTGAGKSTLLEDLKRILPSEHCVFLCDSGEDPFATKVTEIAKTGVYRDATPRSQLIFFWSRLADVIEKKVLPSLKLGKVVIMDGFGGTILTHARYHTRSKEERDDLIELHKDMIRHCVLALGVPPPKYLWLRPSPQVAHDRLQNLGVLPKISNPLVFIEEINAGFDFYGQLPGQTVVKIDADQTPQAVLAAAMSHIDPDGFVRLAA